MISRKMMAEDIAAAITIDLCLNGAIRHVVMTASSPAYSRNNENILRAAFFESSLAALLSGCSAVKVRIKAIASSESLMGGASIFSSSAPSFLPALILDTASFSLSLKTLNFPILRNIAKTEVQKQYY